jgi:hypothetical protein
MCGHLAVFGQCEGLGLTDDLVGELEPLGLAVDGITCFASKNFSSFFLIGRLQQAHQPELGDEDEQEQRRTRVMGGNDGKNETQKRRRRLEGG